MGRTWEPVLRRSSELTDRSYGWPPAPRQRALAMAAVLLSAGVAAFAQKPAAHPEPKGPARMPRKEITEQVVREASRSGIRPVPIRNYIDRFIFEKIQRDNIPHAGLTTDAEFLRRVTLDLTGRLPESSEIRQFVTDSDPGKREKAIDRLMDTPYLEIIVRPDQPFVDRWTYFFDDLFRNGAAQLGTTGRNLFHSYLRMAVLMNIPYDELVREMLTAKARSNWLDAPSNFLARDHVDDDFTPTKVNDSDTYDDLAVTTAKLFLGVNLECVSCHHGKGHLEKINLFLSGIRRDQMWRMAAFFGQMRVTRPYATNQEFAVLDTGTGYDLKRPSVMRIQRYRADVSPQFLLTGEQPAAGEPWRTAFARMLTSHPQFARTTVNLIWAELFGIGIVDPPLEFDLARQDPANPPPAPWTVQPSHPELLNALAQDFMDHKYDLRYLIRLITTSSTYQLSAHFDGEWKESYTRYFARRFVRRLTAEMVCDSILQATGSRRPIPVSGLTSKVTYVSQTYSPEDLSGKEFQGMRDLLTAFGQGNRDKSERDPVGSMIQSSVLLNGEFVKEQVRVQEGGTLWKLLRRTPPASRAEIVDEMFLSFLSRFPSREEKALALRAVDPAQPETVEDFAWSLINRIEFIHNY